MAYEIRTATKDHWTLSGTIKKGERYLDKGFGQREKLTQRRKGDEKLES